jgi:hypothetical protein
MKWEACIPSTQLLTEFSIVLTILILSAYCINFEAQCNSLS